jgi:glycerol kinase
MTQFILSFDQGTTSSRAIVFDRTGATISTAQKEFKQIYPQPGWVEHDPGEIWSSQISVASEAVVKAGLTVNDIIAIGITNQRETTIVWDKASGEPVYNAIVWQDRRTADFCDKLKSEGADGLIKQKTGLVIDAYFSATKLKWILDNVKGARQKANRGQLCFGTVDTWLLWKLTNGQVHATDVSNASRTMLCNIHTAEWDEELLKLFTIPIDILPKIKSNSEVFGYTENVLTGKGIPISGMAGDQQAALFGQMCIQPGMVKNTYGTGCFMLMNTGNKPVTSKNNLLTTIAWKIQHEIQYALEGSVFIAGAVVQWLRDGLEVIRTSSEIEQLSARVPDNGGVYMVPAFAGLGAPYWNQHARGTIVGITRGTTTAHIARAAIESIAYQTMDVLKSMEADAGFSITELRVDGGATVNDLLMQFQSDILNTKVIRPQITETTALGAAYFAGIGVGYFKGLHEIQEYWKEERSFKPEMRENQRAHLTGEWKKAVNAAVAWTA